MTLGQGSITEPHEQTATSARPPANESLAVQAPTVASPQESGPVSEDVVGRSAEPVVDGATGKAMEAATELQSGSHAADLQPLASVTTANWHDLLERLGLAGIVYNVASHCELCAVANGHFEFLLDTENATLYNDSHDEKLRLALQNYFGEDVRISIIHGAPKGETPAMRALRLVAERQQQAVDAIDNDSQLNALITRFDGKLDRSSILPVDP